MKQYGETFVKTKQLLHWKAIFAKKLHRRGLAGFLIRVWSEVHLGTCQLLAATDLRKSFN